MNELKLWFLFHGKSQKLGSKIERECESMNEIFCVFFNCMEVMKLRLESGTRVLN
jgi:hypothetical protein